MRTPSPPPTTDPRPTARTMLHGFIRLSPFAPEGKKDSFPHLEFEDHRHGFLASAVLLALEAGAKKAVNGSHCAGSGKGKKNKLRTTSATTRPPRRTPRSAAGAAGETEHSGEPDCGPGLLQRLVRHGLRPRKAATIRLPHPRPPPRLERRPGGMAAPPLRPRPPRHDPTGRDRRRDRTGDSSGRRRVRRRLPGPRSRLTMICQRPRTGTLSAVKCRTPRSAAGAAERTAHLKKASCGPGLLQRLVRHGLRPNKAATTGLPHHGPRRDCTPAGQCRRAAEPPRAMAAPRRRGRSGAPPAAAASDGANGPPLCSADNYMSATESQSLVGV